MLKMCVMPLVHQGGLQSGGTQWAGGGGGGSAERKPAGLSSDAELHDTAMGTPLAYTWCPYS